MVRKKWRVIVAALICLLLLTFFLIKKPYSNENSHATGNTGDDKAILTVSNVPISVYEFEKNIALFKTEFAQRNGHPPGQADIKNWIGQFIDRTYFLADAYSRGYDTMKDINRAVESMAHLIVSQPGGLAEQQAIEQKLAAGEQGIQEDLKKLPDSMKEGMKQVLIAGKKETIRTAWYQAISIDMKLYIEPEALTRLEQQLKENGAVHEFDQLRFNALRSLPSMRYSLNGEVKRVTTGDFMDYYNNRPMRQEIKTREQLISNMQVMAIDDYLYAQAERAGITREPKFQLDRENYRKNVITVRYELNELRKNITVSNEEINRNYLANTGRFSQATDAVVSLFTFADPGKATQIMFAFKRKSADTVNLKLTESVQKHRHLRYDDKTLPDTLLSGIFDMKVQDVSRPLSWNGKYVVVVKESESGQRIRSLEEVRPILKKEIEEEKLVIAKQEKLASLKKQFSIDNKISYEKYF